MRFVEWVVVNWFYNTECGDEYQKFVVGEKDVDKIMYDEDKGFCDVYFITGERIRYFNINSINFMQDDKANIDRKEGSFK